MPTSDGNAEASYALHYRESDHYFVHEFVGLITTEIIIQGMKTLRAHPEYNAVVPVMWDVRETDGSLLITNDMFKFNDDVRDKVQQVKRDTHLSFLVSDDLQYAIARQFVTIAGWVDQEVRITKSWQEAHDWLTRDLKSS